MTFSQEPAVWVSLATALLSLAIGFGLPVTPEQKTLIIAALTVLAGIVIRTQVSPAPKILLRPKPPTG